MQALCTATVEQLQQVDGVGPERAAVIAAELAELAPVIAKLIDRGVNMTEPGATASTADPEADDAAIRLPLRGPDGRPLTVVVTGTVPGLSRTEGNEAVETLGGKSSSSVSARTDLVVIGPGAGAEAAKADQMGCARFLRRLRPTARRAPRRRRRRRRCTPDIDRRQPRAGHREETSLRCPAHVWAGQRITGSSDSTETSGSVRRSTGMCARLATSC
ncbi:BRCT domain-containing protein [Couchioplanes caeruleus]|uniref:BRCT domain-containing protein n=1 Tax=Couchioplanes caeruleus TaxID=56438 RepID=UPI0008FF5960|nr:BRCT domain-containing protein [Couchioplanes caeruleus]